MQCPGLSLLIHFLAGAVCGFGLGQALLTVPRVRSATELSVALTQPATLRLAVPNKAAHHTLRLLTPIEPLTTVFVGQTATHPSQSTYTPKSASVCLISGAVLSGLAAMLHRGSRPLEQLEPGHMEPKECPTPWGIATVAGDDPTELEGAGGSPQTPLSSLEVAQDDSIEDDASSSDDSHQVPSPGEKGAGSRRKGAETKEERKARKEAAKVAKASRKAPEGAARGQKPCTRCTRMMDVLIRCQIDETQAWHMVCGRCWRAVSGGTEDGDADHPHYRYGGVWKNHANPEATGKKPKPRK